MNLLDPRLDKALEQAEISASFRSLFGRKDKPLEGLNQLIAGPMASGKTFQAHEYIAQMHDVGLITNPKPYLIDCSNAQPWAMGKDIKDVTEGSIIVFDDLTDSVAGRQDFRTIGSELVRLLLAQVRDHVDVSREHVVVGTTLQVRASTGPYRPRR